MIRENIEKLIASGITAYRVSKETGIPLNTATRIFNRSTGLDNITLRNAELLSEFYKKIESGEFKMENKLNINLGLVGQEEGKWILAQIDGIYIEDKNLKLEENFKNGGTGTVIYKNNKKYFISNTNGIYGNFVLIDEGIKFEKGFVMRDLETTTSFDDLVKNIELLGFNTEDILIRNFNNDLYIELQFNSSLYDIVPNKFESKDYYKNLIKYYSEVNIYNERRKIEKLSTVMSVTVKDININDNTLSFDELKKLLVGKTIEVKF